MKKLISLLLIAIIGIGMIGCDKMELPEPTFEEQIAASEDANAKVVFIAPVIAVLKATAYSVGTSCAVLTITDGTSSSKAAEVILKGKNLYDVYKWTKSATVKGAVQLATGIGTAEVVCAMALEKVRAYTATENGKDQACLKAYDSKFFVGLPLCSSVTGRLKNKAGKWIHYTAYAGSMMQSAGYNSSTNCFKYTAVYYAAERTWAPFSEGIGTPPTEYGIHRSSVGIPVTYAGPK